MKSGPLELELKRLPQELTEDCAALEKYLVERQATKDTADAQERAQKQVLALTKEVSEVRPTHDQALLASNTELMT